VNRLGNRVPRSIPVANQVATRALTARSYIDDSDRVFTSPRRVRFREMEYALPREHGMAALAEVRRLVERSGWRIGFPVEVRSAPADDAWLSTGHGRESVYLAFHVNARTDHTSYFRGVEQLLKGYDGRPHWGKLTPARRQTWRRRTRTGPTSSGCATSWTPAACSPTPTWTGSWAADDPATRPRATRRGRMAQVGSGTTDKASRERERCRTSRSWG